MSSVVAQFDYDDFLRDGYAVLRGIMKTDVVEEWTAALKYGQKLNDRLLMSDWTEIDWHGLGHVRPIRTITPEEIKNALGGSQQLQLESMEDMLKDEAGIMALRLHSVFPEYFLAGHVYS